MEPERHALTMFSCSRRDRATGNHTCHHSSSHEVHPSVMIPPGSSISQGLRLQLQLARPKRQLNDSFWDVQYLSKQNLNALKGSADTGFLNSQIVGHEMSTVDRSPTHSCCISAEPSLPLQSVPSTMRPSRTASFWGLIIELLSG